MKLTILQQADEELYEAAKYYENQQAGLGYKFLDEVEKHIKWIKLNPTTVRLRQGIIGVSILKYFRFISPMLFTMILYGYWLLLIVIRSRIIGLIGIS